MAARVEGRPMPFSFSGPEQGRFRIGFGRLRPFLAQHRFVRAAFAFDECRQRFFFLIGVAVRLVWVGSQIFLPGGYIFLVGSKNDAPAGFQNLLA